MKPSSPHDADLIAGRSDLLLGIRVLLVGFTSEAIGPLTVALTARGAMVVTCPTAKRGAMFARCLSFDIVLVDGAMDLDQAMELARTAAECARAERPDVRSIGRGSNRDEAYVGSLSAADTPVVVEVVADAVRGRRVC